MEDTRILIAEDDFDQLKRYKRFLNNNGFKAVDTASDGREALRKIRGNIYDIVLADQKMPHPPEGISIDDCGIELLKRIKNRSPDTEVIIITGHGSTKSAFEARGLYAREYLEKPINREKQLLPLIIEISQRQTDKQEARRLYESGEHPIVGKSQAIQNVIRTIEKVVGTNSRVFFTGESGTGKTYFAEYLHLKSNRRSKNFAEKNCAAIAEGLLDSELFGHEKGAFNGAILRKGLFEYADGGTIFLDEIGEASENMQSKLLRVIETGEFERVGGNKTIKTDVRLIAATHKDIQEEMEHGKFSEPLFFKLKAYPIHIPPLREHKEDIPLLADLFLEKYKQGMGRNHIRKFDPKVIELFKQHDWKKNNVRELEGEIQNAVINCDSAEIILPMHLHPNVRVDREPETTPHPEIFDILNIKDYKSATIAFDKLFLEEKLKENNWNIKQTSEEINYARKMIHKKIKKYHLSPK